MLLQIFTLALAAMLSLKSSDSSAVFNVVFIVITAGALLLTTNVILLGGSISFFQSICLLGYCVFPMDIAAIVCYIVRTPQQPTCALDCLVYALFQAETTSLQN